jgi:hypothetical protein
MSTAPPQLDPLPPTFAATARALHRIAERVLAPAQPGGEIALMATPGGFGSPEFEKDGTRYVLLNNSQLGKISKEQRAGEWEVWQTSLHNPDFSAYARNCGALGIRVIDAAELDAALAEAVAHDRPAMVEVITDPDLV